MRKALIYNNYLDTIGGGERLCLDTCLALERMGFAITIATSLNFRGSLENLFSVFGIFPSSTWQLQKFQDEHELQNHCLSQEYDIFVNNTFCSSMANPAKIGIYMLMFPPPIGIEERQNLLTYNQIIVISEFSRIHLHERWGDEFPCVVLPPPISESHACYDTSFDIKERLILVVGRFNVDGHSKCQLDALRTFKILKEQGVLSDKWRLHIAGNLNSGIENERYLRNCKTEASEDIAIETNISFSRLQSLYSRAACLWQFTGIKYPHGQNPELCEHLGLVAVDGLSYGTIPFVFERSGVSFLLKYGINGFMFDNDSELAGQMAVMDKIYGTQAHQDLFHSARLASRDLNFEKFTETFETYIDNLGNQLENNVASGNSKRLMPV